MKNIKLIAGSAIIIVLMIVLSIFIINSGEEEISANPVKKVNPVNVEKVSNVINAKSMLSSGKSKDVKKANHEKLLKSVSGQKITNKIADKQTVKVVITKKTKKSKNSKKNNKVTTVKKVKKVNKDSYKKIGTFRCTAYCGCGACCGGGSGRTASGTVPTAGRTIATDPSIIPLGSKVKINGHTYIAEDTGGAIRGNVIDVFFASHSEALQWGVRYLEVYVER